MNEQECNDYREKIEELLDTGNISKWEDSFLVNVGSQLDRGRGLSEAQRETLDKIIEEKLV